jgi:hypothetical protein
MTEFRQCQHAFDDGRTCGSAAVTGRDYCYHHLSRRGRRIRMARARSQNRRLYLDLPPLDSLSAIHSAACQIVEALAADVIDVRHAQAMLSGLRFVARTIAKADTEAWHSNAFQNDQPQSYDNFESEFGLPKNFDLTTPPEVASPPLAEPSKSQTDNRPPTTDHLPEPPPMPHSGNYCGDHHSSNCDCMLIRADFPVSPEDVEIVEVSETLGSDAAALRGNRLERNWQRRQLRSDRKRYAARALELNMRRAADRMAERKLAAQKLATEKLAAQGAQDQDSSGTSATGKKPPAAAVESHQSPPIEVKSTA